MTHFGDWNVNDTVIIAFNTFSSDDPSASVTITNLAAADVEIHKNGGTTQRSSDAGVTVSIDFDTVTGNHIISIDTSDNTDAGFYAADSSYQVRMEGTTVDGATINAWIGSFTLGKVRTAMDAALVAIDLDHLINVAESDTPADNSIIAKLAASDGDWSGFLNTSDSLEAIRDHVGDGTNLSEAGATGDHLSAVPWNAAWDAQVQSEVDDGLVAFFTSAAQLVDDIWDEVLNAAAHNVASSAGRRLRQIEAAFVVHTGTAQAGAATTITLDTGASATDDIYNGDRVVIVGGTGVGEHGIITDYNGTTKVATMAETWVVNPDATSDFDIVPADCDVESWQHNVVTASASGLPDVNVNEVGDTSQTAGDLMGSIGEENASAAAGDPSTTESLMQYIKQLVNVLVGSTGVTTFPAESDPANNVNLAEAIHAIHALLADAQSEPTGVPAANETVLTKLAYIFLEMRNKVTATASKLTIYGDDDVAEYEYDLSDDGTTATITEANAV